MDLSGHISVLNILVSGALLWVSYKSLRHGARRLYSKATILKGPASKSFLFGLSAYLMHVPDTGVVYDEWARIYGAGFQVPTAFWGTNFVICDPKAIAHVLSHETTVYLKTPVWKSFTSIVFGDGLLMAEGASHKRQRKILNPAFSNNVIRPLFSVFYDSPYKLKSKWDSLLDSSPGHIQVDVQSWMKSVTIDTLGIAGFSHDFCALDGEDSPVMSALNSAGKEGRHQIPAMLSILAETFPSLLRLPLSVNKRMAQLRAALDDIAGRIIDEKTRAENMPKADAADLSMIGALLASEGRLSRKEISAQVCRINTLLLGGFDSTSASLTWALIEMCKHPDSQRRLREELSRFSATDLTMDQLAGDLPYLDAVVHEVLRMHPPTSESKLLAAQDDVIPLGAPITTAAGDTVTSIFVPKGTQITVPVRCLNRSEDFWGPSAKEFDPARWLDEGPAAFRSKEIQGHRHILTFSDGPRTCIGKNFALNNFKTTLSVLIRNFTFEFPDGPETQIKVYVALGPRPKVAGAKGSEVHMYIRRVE
ncbi:cytochrome P450 [Mycena epipterygia]|nr:cytochrome P450 [Mycena epipterygia]